MAMSRDTCDAAMAEPIAIVEAGCGPCRLERGAAERAWARLLEGTRAQTGSPPATRRQAARSLRSQPRESSWEVLEREPSPEVKADTPQREHASAPVDRFVRKTLSEAVRAGDHIYCVLPASPSGHDRGQARDGVRVKAEPCARRARRSIQQRRP